jgi:peptidoglycan/LPS O-acetylase OafA/YrhL
MKTGVLNKGFTVRPFSREGTDFLKGIAIILIALHNYYRWVNPITGENEFGFLSTAAVKSFVFVRSNPMEILHVFFNFLGHYGVQAFIFISAYGLTLSYRKSQPRYGRFILHRFDRLYPAFVLAALMFIVFQIIQTNRLIGTDLLKDLGIQLSLFANLVPGKAMAVCGPWWFYSFIFGFYLVFPPIMWLYSKLGNKALVGLVILGYAFSILMYGPMMKLNLNPYMTFGGHLPELCLGIFLAEKREVKIPYWVIFIAFLLFAGGNTVEWLWPFANLGVSVLLLVLIQSLLNTGRNRSWLFKAITFTGAVSMYIFGLQGFVRYPFVNLANETGSPVLALLAGLLFLVFATGLAYMMKETESNARQWIGRPEQQRGRYLRFLALVCMLPGLFAALFLARYLPGQPADAAGEEVTGFTVTNDFETPNKNYPGRYTDSLFYAGSKAFIMFPSGYFSPGLEADFSKISPDGIFEADASVMLYTTDSLSSGHLILEVWDVPTNERLEWKSEFLGPGKFTTGKWFPCTFTYRIPKEYLHPNYKIKVYLWSIGKGTYYADDLKLELKKRIDRKP